MTVIARGPQNEKKGLLMVYREMTPEKWKSKSNKKSEFIFEYYIFLRMNIV